VILMAAAAACGSEGITTATGSPPTIDAASQVTGPVQPPDHPEPPPVRITGDGVELSLVPWTYCWTDLGGTGICADGSPPTDPEIARGFGPLEVDFPVDDWSFEVSYTPSGVIGAPAAEVAGEVLVRPDPTTTYDVTLMGRSAPGAVPSGDVIVTFRWEP
jgi:hypothetical protein